MKATIAILLICVTGFVSPAWSDMVTDWNQTTLMLNPSQGTLMGGRNLALVHTAIYDAIAAFDGDYAPYHVTASPPEGASREAAATAAAYTVLYEVFTTSDQRATIQARYDGHLALIPDGPAKDAGIAFGQSVAESILDLRSTDGAMAAMMTPHADGTEPGQWRRTSSGEPMAPGWGNVTPWAMTAGSQFDQGGPPALTSQEYADAYNEVRLLGAEDSASRTDEQASATIFWLEHVPRHWHGLARDVSRREGLSLSQNARLFALLSVSLADANIAAWNMKYSYSFWRPETAIHLGDDDGNDGTEGDAGWESFVPAPAHPEYVSGHSITCATAARLLELFFGRSDYAFQLSSMANAEVGPRSFDGFWEAAEEAGRSRIYGGIHFQFSNEHGREAGKDLAEYVFENKMRRVSQADDARTVPCGTGAAQMIPLGLVCLWLMRRDRSGPVPCWIASRQRRGGTQVQGSTSNED